MLSEVHGWFSNLKLSLVFPPGDLNLRVARQPLAIPKCTDDLRSGATPSYVAARMRTGHRLTHRNAGHMFAQETKFVCLDQTYETS